MRSIEPLISLVFWRGTDKTETVFGQSPSNRMKKPTLVLASRSKARAALLRGAGYRFAQVVSNIPEPAPNPGATLGAYVRRLARIKAMAVAKRFPESWVIGADTALLLETRIIGKPRDCRDAVNMLRALAGRTHRICSAVCIVAPRDRTGRRAVRTRVDTARVTLRNWPVVRLRAHVAATRPIHWAGAYAVQHPASCAIVERIRGDLATVIGLPMEKLERLLAHTRATTKGAKGTNKTIGFLRPSSAAASNCARQNPANCSGRPGS